MSDLSRRQLILRGAMAGAALTVPGADALAAVRRRRRRRSYHCLPAVDRFGPRSVIGDCSFASFAPDGRRIALTTSRGIELLDRADGSRRALTGPGFAITADAWHPDGSLLLASGPDAGGVHSLHALDPATGASARLLPDHPDEARAPCFSPDGTKVAFTYRNRYVHQLCMADWAAGTLAAPLNLIPFDPAREPFVNKLTAGLSWYETRGFSSDGTRLYFASDRGGGMLNVNAHYIELATGKRRKVTHDHGVIEGLVVAGDDETIYFTSTRARESGYLTMVTGPFVPPVLGFVAEPTLHELMSARGLAPIGNGDLIAVDATYGMKARMVGKRDAMVGRLGGEIEHWLYRTRACSMSPDGRELAVELTSSAGSNVVLMRRSARGAPPAAALRPTPSPRGAMPLPSAPFGDIDRTFDSPFGGRVRLRLEGQVQQGRFQADFTNFNLDGVKVFGGSVEFQTAGAGFRHLADVRRVNFDETEEAATFYRADVRVDWEGATGGTIDSRSRHGTTSAAWDGTWFANVAPWRAGRRGPDRVPGSQRCKSTGRT